MPQRFPALLVVLLALFGSGQALAFGSCRDATYMAGFDERLEPTSCRTVHTTDIRWRGGSAPLRVIIASSELPSADEAVFRAYVDELASRVGAAMNQMGDLHLGEITILLSTLSYENNHAVTDAPTGECQITFFKTSRELSVDRFQFTMAHELFHCVQFKTWPRLPGEGSARWWGEGTADYFAHLANPASTQADSFLFRFDRDSPRVSLVDMTYQAQVFFLWLGHTQGATAVREFIDGMATSKDRPYQLAAMRRRIPMDTWMAFAQDYMDARIRQPGGRELPGGVDYGRTTVIDGPTSVSFTAKEYVLVRQQLQFTRGRTYTLALSGGGGEFRSRFDESPGEWIDPPERVLACDEDRMHKVLSLAVEGASVDYTIQVEESERIDERACCLVGRWEPTPAAVRSEPDMALSYVGAMLAGAGLDFQCGVGGGGWTLNFTEDATGSVDWRGFTWQCVGREPGGSMSNTFTRNGRTAFTWTVVDRGAGRAEYTENSLAWTHVMQFGPQVKTRVLPDAGPSASGNGFSFQCSDTSLTIQGIYGLNHEQGEYTRIGPPPR